MPNVLVFFREKKRKRGNACCIQMNNFNRPLRKAGEVFLLCDASLLLTMR